jgi:orotidine-5'-phosphate decarboxylase
MVAESVTSSPQLFVALDTLLSQEMRTLEVASVLAQSRFRSTVGFKLHHDWLIIKCTIESAFKKLRQERNREILRHSIFFDLKLFESEASMINICVAIGTRLKGVGGRGIVNIHATAPGLRAVVCRLREEGLPLEVYAQSVFSFAGEDDKRCFLTRRMTRREAIEIDAELADMAGCSGIVCPGALAGEFGDRFPPHLRVMATGIRESLGDRQHQDPMPPLDATRKGFHVVMGRELWSGTQNVLASTELITLRVEGIVTRCGMA